MRQADLREERLRVYLHPGQVFASRAPCEVTTVLGSCVGVVLVDEARRAGGACHFLLPFEGRGDAGGARFGETAITILLDKMQELGSAKRDLIAKVFGGASMLAASRSPQGTLGEKNVEVALARLAREGIPVVASEVGGANGRKVVFFTDEGHVWVKSI
jgi:chemotaxis protein CheD